MIQVYTSKVIIDNIKGEKIAEYKGDLSVTLEVADVADFVSEFNSEEILNAMDYTDIIDWVDKIRELEDENENYNN